MLREKLEKSILRVPAVGIGTGDGFWDSRISREEKVRLIRLGIERGMNLVDTAEGYGNGISEEVVGEAVKGVREKVILASKFSPEHSSYGGVLRSAEASLKRLGTDRIDLYQVHWLNPSVSFEETARALRNLLRAKKIRTVGVCNFTREELMRAQQMLGEDKIVSLQAEYNLFERTIETDGTMDYCFKHGITVIAYSPLDQGRISFMKNSQSETLDSIAKKYERTRAQVILRWLVSRPSVVALTRATQERHLVENAGALSFDLSNEEITRIDKAFHFQVISIPTDRIRVSKEGEWNHDVYQTVEEAVANKLAFAPSPLELAESVRRGGFSKPVRVIPSKDRRYDYDLIGGRIRYWAWVIAHEGRTPIPAVVREGLP